MMAEMRKPPSSKFRLLRPVKGQVSAKRSPPLSLVKMIDCVVGNAACAKRLKHAAYLEIEVLYHALIGPLRPAIKIDERVTDEPPGFCLISRPLPRPVRRIEVQAQQEGLSSFGVAVDDIDGVVAE